MGKVRELVFPKLFPVNIGCSKTFFFNSGIRFSFKYFLIVLPFFGMTSRHFSREQKIDLGKMLRWHTTTTKFDLLCLLVSSKFTKQPQIHHFA